jgi:uncharacterized protein
MQAQTTDKRGKYRHIRGGLDRAVKQAELRNLYDLSIVDADCHQDEPFTLFPKYLPDALRREWGRLEAMNDADRYMESYSKFTASSGDPLDPLKLQLMKINEHLSAESPYNRNPRGTIQRTEYRSNFDQDPLGIYEMKKDQIIDIFAKRMHDLGIQKSVIFPGNLLNYHLSVNSGPSPMDELEFPLASAYIDFMLENFLGKYPEILACVYVPTRDPQKGAELIDRVGSEKGVCGVLLNPMSPGPLAGDESWNPIYEAAEKSGLPVCFHAVPAPLPPLDRFKKNKFLPVHALCFPWTLAYQLTSIVIEGVPERFPKLKFVFMEGGITWIPWVMYRLDSEYLMRKSEAPLLTKLPSEYVKSFFFSSQPLERPPDKRDLEWIFRAFNAETQLLYASDYPHWDFDLPSVIFDLPFLSMSAKKQILGDNARRVFKFS